MLKRIFFSLLFFVLLIVLGSFLLPKHYEVKRSVVINATKQDVHAMVNDLQQWDRWAPWVEADPSLQITPGEITSGVGASQHWLGKDGDGRLQFTDSDPDRGVEYDIWFMQDAYQSKAKFDYIEQEDGTKVVWSMAGEMPTPVVGPYMAMLMDTTGGPMFEQGLEKLKQVVEEN